MRLNRPRQEITRVPHAAEAPDVQQSSDTEFMSVEFRPTEEDLRVIEANRRKGEKTSDVIRRALRLLDRKAWEERAHADMHRLRAEDVSAEADAWEYDADGNIRITGTGTTVPARSQDHARSGEWSTRSTSAMPSVATNSGAGASGSSSASSRTSGPCLLR